MQGSEIQLLSDHLLDESTHIVAKVLHDLVKTRFLASGLWRMLWQWEKKLINFVCCLPLQVSLMPSI